MPMKRIPFALDSYQHPSLPLISRRMLNLYAEKQPEDARSDMALIPTPGLTFNMSIGTGPILAMNNDLPGRIYVVSGSTAYRVNTQTGALTVIGTVGAIGYAGPELLKRLVTIAVGPTAAVICVPPRAYTCTHDGTLNQIGGTFPGADSVCYQDGYFVFSGANDDARWFVSDLLNPNSYNALAFAYSDALPNVLRRAINHRGDVWLLGEAGIQVWYDAGGPIFPFLPQSGGVIEKGSVSARSVVKADGSVWWIGTDGIVYRSEGYLPKRVSSHAIEALILTLGLLPDTALAYVQGGHTFVGWTFGTRSLFYDCATGLWAERSSAADGNGRWRGNAVAMQGIPLVGDYQNGNVYALDPAADLDNNAAIFRQATGAPLWGGTNRAFMARVEVEMEVGAARAPGPVLLEWSDDGGATFPRSRTLSAGAAGQTRKRVYATRLGSFRERVMRVSTTGHATIYAMDADVEEGAT